ncbi:MAG: phosphotransferase [Gammaproteobacteria bacterium]|nr:phosphotransferase [Gammaproteobacteria bacterium]MDH5304769.1 phosphotransferase [Gammaproteobacteria bacterium]MDH5322402.1 phosphotransferase [Gammaproteobacteria bacterium]
MDAIAAISTVQPKMAEEQALQVLAESFDLRGRLKPLLSERDQNFRVTTEDGREYVLKIANSAEHPVTTDFQIRALLHIESRHCPVATPRIRRTVTGEVSIPLRIDAATHVSRVVSYLPGELLSSVATGPRLAANLGECAAHLDLALAGFEHAGENQTLLWDMQRADRLRELLQYVADDALRTAVRNCIDDFDTRVKPRLPGLRAQVIHADLHGDNVLVRTDDHTAIAGVIDFGDMLRAPLIMEVAIAAAYLRAIEGDALRLIAPFVSAFHRVVPLQQAETSLLFDLVRARLSATISILRWRAAMRGATDKYSLDYMQSERSAETFLARLDAIGRDAFTERVRGACAEK